MLINNSPARIDGAYSIAQPGASPAPIAARPRPARDLDRAWGLPGLCWNASVMTSFGALPVQVLRKHDPLRTMSGQILRIEWIDKIQLDEDFLGAYPDAQPILIRAGALGLGLPKQDVMVSPQQSLTVPGTGGQTRIARDLLGRPGVMRQPQSMVTYYVFHCGQAAQVQAEGLALLTEP